MRNGQKSEFELMWRPASDFNLWLKSLTNADGSPVWSIAQLNTIPIGVSRSRSHWPQTLTLSRWQRYCGFIYSFPSFDAEDLTRVIVSMVWFWAFISDYYQTRWLVVMFQAVRVSQDRDTTSLRKHYRFSESSHPPS